MTAQIGEKLIDKGRIRTLCSQPLEVYFALGGDRPDWAFTCTALWRGYVGTWEIRDGRLYLVGVSGSLQDGRQATLETLFPGFPERVFAHWYTGILRVPEGTCLQYVHFAFESVYERDRLIDVEQGVVLGTRFRINGHADPQDGFEEYGVAAMTVFPRDEEAGPE